MSPTTHKQLAGYSGAFLYLMSTGERGYFVRKVARTPETSDRLRRQMNKQNYAHSLPDRPFGVPSVLGSGLAGDCFYYDMEFVDGMDCPAFLNTSSADQVREVGIQIVDALRYFSVRGNFELCEKDWFSVLARRILDVMRLELGLPAQEAIMMLDGLDKLSKSPGIAPTLCHGDLSLENILIDRTGKIILVDFLDSPFCHYWQDVAKLWLDLEGQWYARRYEKISEWVLAGLREGIFAFVRESAVAYLKHHELLIAINFMRILPYARSEADRQMLLRNIHNGLKRIQTT